MSHAPRVTSLIPGVFSGWRQFVRHPGRLAESRDRDQSVNFTRFRSSDEARPAEPFEGA